MSGPLPGAGHDLSATPGCTFGSRLAKTYDPPTGVRCYPFNPSLITHMSFGLVTQETQYDFGPASATPTPGPPLSTVNNTYEVLAGGSGADVYRHEGLFGLNPQLLLICRVATFVRKLIMRTMEVPSQPPELRSGRHLASPGM